ncbi:MAG: hypothetical protein GF393_10515 [Armatimonadia bacterium]|nr:hypothetical protein [Armatimonadia bacterium]
MARRVRKKPKRKLSTAAWFGIGCGGVLVIGLIIIGIIYAMLTGEPELPPEATAGDSSETPRAAQSAPPLEQQVEAVERAQQSNQPVQVTMTIRESELNQTLAREGTGQVRDLQVFLGSGSIAATGKTDYRGRTVHLTLRATPTVSNGRLQATVTEVMVGRLQAPEAVRQELQAQIDQGLQKATQGRNVRIDSVQVQPGVMTLTGWVGGR